MKNLTFEHLAPYLAYGLKIETYGYFFDHEVTPEEFTDILTKVNDNRWKLILHPLSDLTKEIEVNGERFVPMDVLYKIFNKKLFTGLSKYGMNRKIELYVKCMPYFIVEKLLEWHFDIHDLIDSGLAIDINTLKS